MVTDRDRTPQSSGHPLRVRRTFRTLNAMSLHCCERMSAQVNMVCEKHPNPFECPDVLVHYSPKFGEYGLVIHDGGSGSIQILFCPFCGNELPVSKRDRWFHELEDLGFSEPLVDDIPEQYKSDAWYRT